MPSLYECTFVCAVAAADIEDALGQALGDSGEIEHPGEDIKLRCSPTRRPQPLARGQVAVGCILTRGVYRHRESLPQPGVGCSRGGCLRADNGIDRDEGYFQ